MNSPNTPQRFALLVGVDLYLSDNSRPHTNGDPVNLTTLKGCVRDVEIIRHLLQTKFGLNQPRILTSSPSLPSLAERRVPSEPQNKWPTLNNIKREIYEIYEQSHAGDLFFFFFSGHGAHLKTTTESPESRTTDPSLMTADYCCSQPAIRGWQLNNWLRDFHNKGVRVVVILDSCHSGGAWRTGRQIRSPEDWTPPPNLPADEAAVQGAQRKPGSRQGDLDMDWDVNPEGMTLMAACRADQHAEEIIINGKVCGAFTGTLQAYFETTPNPSTLTYRVIRDHVAGRIPPQEPQVFGQDRLAFYGDHVPFSATPALIQIRENAFYLPIGKAHGVSVGAQFTTSPPTPRVILSAQEVQDFESKVAVQHGSTSDLQDLTELVPFRWSYSGELRILVDQRLGPGFREQLDSSLRDRLVGDIQIAESNELPIDNEHGVWFWLKGADPGNVDILGPEALLGSEGPVRGWKPIRRSHDSGAADSAVALAHLARFDQILRLKDHCSQDSRHFTTTLDPDPKDKTFHHNQKFTLTFQSQDTADLFFMALIFSSGFHIKQLFPEHDATKLVCPNGRESFEFRLKIPDELKQNGMEGNNARHRDVLRIIITRGKQLSLKSVELPDLWNAYEVERARTAGERRFGELESNCKWWICDYELWLC